MMPLFLLQKITAAVNGILLCPLFSLLPFLTSVAEEDGWPNSFGPFENPTGPTEMGVTMLVKLESLVVPKTNTLSDPY